MTTLWQNAIVLSCVIAAGAYVAKRFSATLLGNRTGACGGCRGCNDDPSQTQRPMIVPREELKLK